MKLSYLILAAVVIWFLDSCLSAEKLTNKALAKDRAKVAEITRAEFPCVETFSDTTVVTDTLYDIIDCPEDTGGYLPVIGTGSTTTPATVKVPVKIPVRTVTIIKKVEDSTKIFLIQSGCDIAINNKEKEIIELNAVIDKRDERIETLDKKVDGKNSFIKWLLIALAAVVLALFLKIKRIL